MSQRILNPLLERYHGHYTLFENLTKEQIDTFCLCSYVMMCIAEVRSTDYSGAVIPAVRTLEESLRSKFQASRKRTRSLGTFVDYYHRHREHYHDLCDRTGYPDGLLDRESFLTTLRRVSYYRGQAGHAYISRKTVARCLTLCAMLVNILNTIQPELKTVNQTTALVMVKKKLQGERKFHTIN